MTTRSLIGMQHGDGSITAIYCQCDGYPSYNGKVLRDHYTDGWRSNGTHCICTTTPVRRHHDQPD